MRAGTLSILGLLDEEQRRQQELEVQQARAAQEQADKRTARTAEGCQLANEFIDRAQAAGLRPTFELKYEMYESRPVHAATRY